MVAADGGVRIADSVRSRLVTVRDNSHGPLAARLVS